MKKQTVSNLGKFGIVKDIDPPELAEEAWSDGNNVRCDNNTIESIDGYIDFSDKTPIYIFPYDGGIVYVEPSCDCTSSTLTFSEGSEGSEWWVESGGPQDIAGLFSGCTATSYSVTGTLPNGLNFNTSTGQLTGTPAFGSAGTYPNISFTKFCACGSCSTNTATISIVGS